MLKFKNKQYQHTNIFFYKYSFIKFLKYKNNNSSFIKTIQLVYYFFFIKNNRQKIALFVLK